MNIEAVIFDLDGLMIDSERFHFEAIVALVTRYGKKANEAWFESMIGMDNIACAKIVIAETNIPLTPETYIKEIYDIILEILPDICQPNPGLNVVIDELIAADMKLGVASNSHRSYVSAALSCLGIIDLYDCIVSADDVQKAKPAPDVYLAAAHCLGIEPHQCLALEDSPVGMMAALNAGMPCAVIPSPHVAEAHFSEATFIFSSLEEFNRSLPEILSNGKVFT